MIKDVEFDWLRYYLRPKKGCTPWSYKDTWRSKATVNMKWNSLDVPDIR
jgi:hypothetical protein